MKLHQIRERFLREESGFTLPEVLVSMIMMVTVLFALYAIFDMSLKVFGFGNDKVEAAENARIGLERMEREIRAAYPRDPSAEDYTLLGTYGDDFTSNEERITFGNDLNGNDAVDIPDEVIVYYAKDNQLKRRKGNSFSSLADLGENDSLKFEYYKDNGTTKTTPAAAESEIDLVRIELQTEVDGRTQTLSTNVSLRNRDG